MKNNFGIKDKAACDRYELLKGCKYSAVLEKPDSQSFENGFKWIVSINGKRFKYFEGIGHVVNQQYYNKLIAKELLNHLTGIKRDIFSRDYYKGVYKVERVNNGKLTPPKLESVMYCLLSDYSCAVNADSFKDFCAEFGYDVDSRAALKTYKQLQANAVKVAGLGLDLEALQEAFSDY